jgi:hypothetical protein
MDVDRLPYIQAGELMHALGGSSTTLRECILFREKCVTHSDSLQNSLTSFSIFRLLARGAGARSMHVI